MKFELHIQRSYKLKKAKIMFGWHVISSLNTQQLFLGFSGSSLPRPRAIPSGREGWDKKSYNRVQRVSWLESHYDSHLAAACTYTWAWR